MKQQSVNARDLGILVRDVPTKTRVPHYLIPPNTPLPTSATQQFGTVVPNQKRVHLVIVESGTDPEQPYVVLGDCKIEGLPPNLPEGSKIDVTISYDPQARVHVSAKDAASGKSAEAEILRQENIVAQLTSDPRLGPDSVILSDKIPVNPFKQAAEPSPKPAADLSDEKWTAFFENQEDSKPVPLCNECGKPLDPDGHCPDCEAAPAAARGPAKGIGGQSARGTTPTGAKASAAKPAAARPAAGAAAKPQPAPKAATAGKPQPAPPGGGKPAATKPGSSETIKTSKPAAQTSLVTAAPAPGKSATPHDEGEDDFWKYVGE